MAEFTTKELRDLGERNNIKLEEITAMNIPIDVPIEVLFDESYEAPFGKASPKEGDRTIGYFGGIRRITDSYHEILLKGTPDTRYRAQQLDIRFIKKINLMERKQ